MPAAASPEEQAKLSNLNKTMEQLRQAGKFAEAIPIAQKILELSEKTLAPEHHDIATRLSDLAGLYFETGDYAKTQALQHRAGKIIENALGPDHPETATNLNNQALAYQVMGEYAKAESLYQRALGIREKMLGPEHLDTANSLATLAQLYTRTGEYGKAETLLQRALKTYEKALGSEHQNTATVLSYLAEVYLSMGVYDKAEPLFQRALKIYEKVLGLEHPNTATALNNLAALYESTADYAKAEALFQRVLAIYDKTLGPEHPNTATALNNLAMLYGAIADYAKAEFSFQRVLKICEKTLGPNHPNTATALGNLAELYLYTRDYTKAETLFQRALTIHEKARGAEHPETASSLSNLAEVYRSIGAYDKAELLFQRALMIDEKVLGLGHPNTATALNNLGLLYSSAGNNAKAEPYYRRGLTIRVKALGAKHPFTAMSLFNLAMVYLEMGDTKEALPLVAQFREAQEANLSNILSFTSERQRLAFQNTTYPYTLPGAQGDADELAKTLFRQKGIVLDSLLEDRLAAHASNDPVQRKNIERLRAAKQRLMKLALEVPKDLSDLALTKIATEKQTVATDIERLEGGLARQVPGLGKARHALSITVAQVVSCLPQNGALVEVVRYPHKLGKSDWEVRYGAVVVAPTSEPKWVSLGRAEEIEKQVQLYRQSARGETDEATLDGVLKTLEEQVWAPIQRAFPAGVTTVIVSPDAELNFVSFATLLTSDDRFVGEKYSLRYVACGRDLLRKTKPTKTASIRVFANPDFATHSGGVTSGGGRTTPVSLRSNEMRNLQSISLNRLPGTEKESFALQRHAETSGWQVRANLDRDATEAELRRINSPRVLHLATHGFFLPATAPESPPTSVSISADKTPGSTLLNPMHRSGLALAGAEATLKAWSRGEVPPTDNDGVVTAEEVGGLMLGETWLVVLSACDTGRGDARAGEGVMGLRRGFVQAGSQNLLMTLWPISDEATVNIMLDFYDAAFKTGNAPQALADTQRDWLVKLRKERGLLPAVQLAGPFIMSSQGRP